MITVERIVGNLLELKAVGQLHDGDFLRLAPQVNTAIAEHGVINIYIDASGLEGWASVTAAEEHFRFIKNHHAQVRRIVIIAGHAWQHWMVAFAQMFIHPAVKVFDRGQEVEARAWINA